MASTSFTPSNASSTGLVDSDNLYPIVPSPPITPLQDSLLNSPFINFEEVNEDQLEDDSDGLIDPDLIQANFASQSQWPIFGGPFPMEVDPSLVFGPDIHNSGSQLSQEDHYQSISQLPAPGDQHQPTNQLPGPGDHYQPINQLPRQFLVSKPISQSHFDKGKAPSSVRVKKTDGSTNCAKQTTTKVKFVDPMHPQAHLNHSAIFCCQIPICIRDPRKDYEHCFRQFILHFSRPTISSPSYGGRAGDVLPQSQNPDIRIPMLLLSGARMYKVEKLGEHRVVRFFVGDLISRKKYWEIFPGGLAEMLGLIDHLRDMSAEAGASSTWKCNSHGDIWNVSILENVFDNGTANNTTTPVTDDSGYASSPGKIHDHSHSIGNFNGDAVMANTTGSGSTPGKIEEQNFVRLDNTSKFLGLSDSDHAIGNDFMQSQGYTWDDDLLEEVTMFNANDPDSDDTVGHDFDNL
ncbi:hypothetical protein SBOR_6271 [Sclerotinia borealis F-4128]|uniref:Uncharacterized protein n=1 Tax=Sclerotinia borealis (strain F-4128) TaxID=1432307 RepID=W9CEZ8_SCLBF|nr:hypothetical protein SBOR_6271 [Sclerotinia borealis F-4128]